MQIKDTLKLTCGSIVVYYVMAACSASSGPSAGAGGSSGGSSGGSTASSGSGSSSGAASSSGSGSLGSPVPDANADETQSGSRLKAAYFVGGDGSKQFAGYFEDSTRNNEQCSFLTAGDGSIRCMPGPLQGASLAEQYADSACSSPVIAGTAGCTPTPYAYVTTYTNSACYTGAVYHVYPVGNAYSGALYSNGAGTCTSVGTTLAGSSYFSTGAEIPASSFQQATIQTE